MNIMDFNVKKLAADAGTFLSRAVQVQRRRRRRLRPGGVVAPGRASGGRVGDGVAPVPGPGDGRGLAPLPRWPFSPRSPSRRPAPWEASRDAAQGVLGPGHLGFTPGRRPRCPSRRGRARRAPWRHPHPPLRSLSPSGLRPTKKGVSFSCPSTQRSCQLCSHQPSLPLEGLSQSLAARGGDGDCLSLSVPQLHQGRRTPRIRGAPTRSPDGLYRAGVKGGRDSRCCVPGHIGGDQARLASGALGREKFTASPCLLIL